MINLFGEATDRLCKKLDVAASEGEDVEMESLFSRLTLDVIGKAVFNYHFDSLTNDTGIVEVSLSFMLILVYMLLKFSLISIIFFLWINIRWHLSLYWSFQAVYTVLREAEDRSVSPIPTWNIPIWKDISPRQRKVNGALKLVNDTLDELIAICKVM